MTGLPVAVPMGLVEHVAVYASEHSDTELEQICDLVLSGRLRPQWLLPIIGNDHELEQWCQRWVNGHGKKLVP